MINYLKNGINSNLSKAWDKIFKHKLYKDLISGKAIKENPISQNKTGKTKKIKNNPVDKDIKQIY